MKTVSLGMLAIGLCVFFGRVSWWWFKSGKGARNVRELLPFLTSCAALALVGACVGGLLGTLLGWILEGFGWVGDTALEKGTGADAVSVSRAAEFGTLTPYGSVLMLVIVVVMIAFWKSAVGVLKKELGFGSVAGICLGPFFGAVTLTPMVNSIGASTIQAWFFA
ncbi:hypothetical protein OG730_41910 (plasmid) [Streptomyces sp. NBC_01298]|uniref:hypothetical protein n=1 Tax=Streptomyces sp. NBC_01298 TaxID=2903817 RepID=UPI002E10F2ED|nr:hypothetical protein OG730_41910 [Streptomyces sp. NBC_01298]